MIKTELIARLVHRYPKIRRDDIERVVATVLGCLGRSLSAGDRVELRGFGTFKVKTRPPHMARNPKTGEAITVIQKNLPYFRVSKQLLERMNEPTGKPVRDGDGIVAKDIRSVTTSRMIGRDLD